MERDKEDLAFLSDAKSKKDESAPLSEAKIQRAKRWLVRGRVQGVGFRYFVQNAAAELGLKGWVRNLDSGEVEVYAVGGEKQLSELAAALHAGPRMADVRGVDEREEAVERLSGFSVR